MIAQNDNGPRYVGEFKTLAERRAWLASRPKEDPAPVLAWPTLERIAYRTDKAACSVLITWRDLNNPQTTYQPANDNQPFDNENGCGLPQRRIRPTIKEIKFAAGLDGTEVDETLTRTRMLGDCEDEYRIRVGGLLFNSDGKLVKYINRHGTWLYPRERPKERVNFVSDPIPRQPENYVEMQMEARAELAVLRTKLGSHADILDMAISSATAREVGEFLGCKNGKSAERAGVAAIDKAIQEFQKIAA